MAVGCGLQRVGREDHDEVDAHAPPVHLPEARHLGGDLAAQHIDGDLVAELESKSLGDVSDDGDAGSAIIVLRPPLAGHQRRAFRHCFGIGEAAVAAQRPGRIGRHLHLIGRHAVHGGDAAAQHGRVVDGGDARFLEGHFAEGGEFAVLHVEHEEGRRLLRKSRAQFLGDGAVSERERHEEREAKTQRENDRHRRCTRAMQSEKGMPDVDVARARQAGNDPHQEPGKTCQQDEGADEAEEIIAGHAHVREVGEDDERGDQHQRCRHREALERGPSTAVDHARAEESSTLDAADAGEWQACRCQRHEKTEEGREEERLP